MNRKFSNKLAPKLLLSFIACLLTLVLVEGIFRLLGWGNLIIYEPDSNFYWRPKPNQSCYTKIGRKPIFINSHGTRGPDFSTHKPTGVFRILFLGDSRTFGWGLSEEETFVRQIEVILQPYLKNNQKLEAINAGVNAWSYEQIYIYLREVALSYNPDLVVIANANLWTEFSEDASETYKRAMMKRVWLKNLLRRSAFYHYIIEVRLAKYYHKYRRHFIPAQPREDDASFANSQEKSEQEIREILIKCSEMLLHKQVPVMFVHIPRQDQTNALGELKTLALKQELSELYKFPFIDLSLEFNRFAKEELYLEADPIHPNAVGNRVIANHLYAAIINQF